MRIAFAGTPHFGALVLGALLGSGHEVALVITQPEIISTPDFVKEIKSLGVEALTVAAFGQILREPLLGGLPCINVHASLLPKYRGAAPIERAMMAGERETGVSIMDITPKVDTGAVYRQRVVPIGEEDDAGSMYEKLGRAGGEALAEVLEAIERSGMEPDPQDESAATYVEKISLGDREINWQRSALEIVAQVMGLSPHIGAFTIAGGHRLKVWKAIVAEAPAEADQQTASEVSDRLMVMAVEPGGITIDGDRLFVRCGTGALELVEVQPEGKRRMAAADFVRGHKNAIEAKKLGEL